MCAYCRSTCLKEMRTLISQAQERESERGKVKTKIMMLKNQVMRETAQEPLRDHPQGY